MSWSLTSKEPPISPALFRGTEPSPSGGKTLLPPSSPRRSPNANASGLRLLLVAAIRFFPSLMSSLMNLLVLSSSASCARILSRNHGLSSRPSSSFRGSRWVEQSPGPPPSGACASLGSAHTFQVTQADPRSGRSTERKGVFVIAGLGPRGQTTYLGAGEQAEMIDCVICVPREGRRACRGSHTGARSPRPPARECLTSPSRGCLCSFYNTVLRVHAE
ncbi:hypothetical protein NN561_017144 [Cricetulus griseus]